MQQHRQTYFKYLEHADKPQRVQSLMQKDSGTFTTLQVHRMPRESWEKLQHVTPGVSGNTRNSHLTYLGWRAFAMYFCMVDTTRSHMEAICFPVYSFIFLH